VTGGDSERDQSNSLGAGIEEGMCYEGGLLSDATMERLEAVRRTSYTDYLESVIDLLRFVDHFIYFFLYVLFISLRLTHFNVNRAELMKHFEKFAEDVPRASFAKDEKTKKTKSGSVMTKPRSGRRYSSMVVHRVIWMVLFFLLV
jgi:hypothetical protein